MRTGTRSLRCSVLGLYQLDFLKTSLYPGGKLNIVLLLCVLSYGCGTNLFGLELSYEAIHSRANVRNWFLEPKSRLGATSKLIWRISHHN